MDKKKRIFSGIKPTGDLHIGNYLGAIKNWIDLQNDYDSIFGIVDYHAMTTSYDAKDMEERVLKIVMNYLACGLDPEKATIMIQSQVKAHAELAWILNTITPMSWLQRVPTFKEKSRQQTENINMGLLDYPVLMAADILLYKADAVPVGEDQLAHVELTREILRRFHHQFGKKIFPEPKGILGVGKRVKGLDGAEKMGKSLNNCIYLNETEKQIWKKVSRGVTDPARIRRDDPGDPKKCSIFALHELFTDEKDRNELTEGCKAGTIGCVDCKKLLAKNINNELLPIREKYFELEKRPDYVRDIINTGNKRCNEIASRTMNEIYSATGLNYSFLKK